MNVNACLWRRNNLTAAICFFNIKYNRGGPHCRDFIKRGQKKTVQTCLARCQTAGAGLKRPKDKQNRTKQEALADSFCAHLESL